MINKIYTIGFYMLNNMNNSIFQQRNNTNPYKIGDYVSFNDENKSTHKILSITHNIKSEKILIIVEEIKY